MYPQVAALANMYGGYNGVQQTGGPQGISSPGGSPTATPAFQNLNQRFMNMPPQQAALAQYFQGQPQPVISPQQQAAMQAQQQQMFQQQYNLGQQGGGLAAGGYNPAYTSLMTNPNWGQAAMQQIPAPPPAGGLAAGPAQPPVNIAGAQFDANGNRVQQPPPRAVPFNPQGGITAGPVLTPAQQSAMQLMGGGGLSQGAAGLARYYQR